MRRRRGASATGELREAIALSPALRILIVQGLTDLQTPYMISRYIVAHLPMPQNPAPVALKLYPGGHMLYMRAATRARLRGDAADLYRARTE
jgi:carboxypeptidase C (cathepsin A)